MERPQRGLSPEAVLIFAFLEARLCSMSRKKRDALLAEMLRVLEGLADAPINMRAPDEVESRKIALEWTRKELTRLIA